MSTLVALGEALRYLGTAVMILWCGRRMSVPGTRRRYLFASAFRALRGPAMMVMVLRLLKYATSDDGATGWAMTGVALFDIAFCGYLWWRDDDDDDWFGDKKKKLRSWWRTQRRSGLAPAGVH